jgi:hypothetical protein
MKSGILAVFGAFGLLVLSGPVHQLAIKPRPAEIAMPLWMNIPAEGQIASVSFTGSVGREQTSGIVDVQVEGSGEREFSAMKARLAANGFQVEERLTSVDSLFGASNFAVAEDPVSGRRLRIIRLDGPGGATLRVMFDNPPAQLAQVQ